MNVSQRTKRLLASRGSAPVRGRPRHVLIWDLLSLGISLPMLGAAAGDTSQGARRGYAARSWVYRLATGKRLARRQSIR